MDIYYKGVKINNEVIEKDGKNYIIHNDELYKYIFNTTSEDIDYEMIIINSEKDIEVFEKC